jgi:hypothetical protein
MLAAGVLLTLSIVVVPGGSGLTRYWLAGPILWGLGAVGLLARLGLDRRRRPSWRAAAAILALAAPWTLLGVSYSWNILRQGRPFDIAHLVLPPSILVTGGALWAAVRVFRPPAA